MQLKPESNQSLASKLTVLNFFTLGSVFMRFKHHDKEVTGRDTSVTYLVTSHHEYWCNIIVNICSFFTQNLQIIIIPYYQGG